MQYRDYTKLTNHRVRAWKLSDGIPLTAIGGLDAAAIGAAATVGVLVALPVALVAALFNLAPTVVGALVMAAVTWWFYGRMTKEDVKDTPQGLLKKALMKRWQPGRYARAIGADWVATRMHWQVILWRPEWSEVRIGGLRRWETYDPAPIGDDNRRAIDITGAGEIAGWRDVMVTGTERSYK